MSICRPTSTIVEMAQHKLLFLFRDFRNVDHMAYTVYSYKAQAIDVFLSESHELLL